MSRLDPRRVEVRPPDGAAFELPCLWVPRSDAKVLAIWRIGGALVGSVVVSEGQAYVVQKIVPHDEITEAATLGRVSSR